MSSLPCVSKAASSAPKISQILLVGMCKAVFSERIFVQTRRWPQGILLYCQGRRRGMGENPPEKTDTRLTARCPTKEFLGAAQEKISACAKSSVRRLILRGRIQGQLSSLIGVKSNCFSLRIRTLSPAVPCRRYFSPLMRLAALRCRRGGYHPPAVPDNPSVTALPCHLPLHKGGSLHLPPQRQLQR